ncbi:hypothetical protein [Bacteroides acidifaciens]|uniref:hypothetical protein n=1 Tax=Bacteroides acidifaciens TaxID=85831 RepID=UPI00272A12CC|nr:hypothetical protein [Bacteroides acidifaciens]
MDDNTYELYTKQIVVVLQELKKLKQLKGISGDMDLLDEIRKAYNLLTDLSGDWSIGVEKIYKILGYYILHSDASMQEKESDWSIISAFLVVLGKLQSHNDYIATNQILFEELLTTIEHEETFNNT